MLRLMALIFLMKTWLHVFFIIEVCRNSNQAFGPWAVLKYLLLAPSRPEDAFRVQVGQGGTTGKDCNTAFRGRLDS